MVTSTSRKATEFDYFEYTDPPSVEESAMSRGEMSHKWGHRSWLGFLIVGTILIWFYYRFIEVVFFWLLMIIDYKVTKTAHFTLNLIDLIRWLIKRSKKQGVPIE